MINIDDFKKIDLRVAKIEQVEKIENSKLLKLIVDLGNEKRTIVAGIGEKYQPEELLGQLIVVVANLEPKEIRGIKSEGMLLAVEDDKGPVLIVPLEQVTAGSKIK
jgi:methionyl-tRNA synthetase